MAQKLWEKNVQVDHEVDVFTVGKDREMDLYLAKYDVLGSMAHITMLESIGLLEKEELSALLAELKNIYKIAESGNFVIEDGIEDVHSQVELMLTRKLGDIGKKIHSGRSRNDQVLVDLKLFTRAEIRELVELVSGLFEVLQAQSEKYKSVLLPGYTHLQVAMPSSFGLWFGAYAESLVDDLQLLQAAYKICNRNPLGSAAGYGSSFPLNRQMTTDLRAFPTMQEGVRPLRFVPSSTGLPSKRCPSIGFLSRADTEIGVFRRVAPTTRLRLEFPRETGLILRCAGKVRNPFQTKQGNRPSRRDQEGIRGSEQAVHRTLVFPSSETRVSGNFCANIKVANYRFKLQDGTWGFQRCSFRQSGQCEGLNKWNE